MGNRERYALWVTAVLALICGLAALIVSALNWLALAEVMEMVHQIQEAVETLAESNEVMEKIFERLERLGK